MIMCLCLFNYFHFSHYYHIFCDCLFVCLFVSIKWRSTLLFIFLSLASMNGSVDVARILVENGADVNKLDKIRKSSLMVRFIGKQRYLNDF